MKLKKSRIGSKLKISILIKINNQLKVRGADVFNYNVKYLIQNTHKFIEELTLTYLDDKYENFSIRIGKWALTNLSENAFFI